MVDNNADPAPPLSCKYTCMAKYEYQYCYTRHQFLHKLVKMKLLLLFLAIFISWQISIVIAKFTEQVLSVDSYGAIANDSSVQAAVKNSQAVSQVSPPLWL